MKSLAVCLLGLLVLVACGDRQPTASVDLPGPTAAGKALTDADATRDGADDLGDITDLSEVQFPTNTLNGGDDAVDYYQFSLTAERLVGLALRKLDFNADLFLEDNAGTVLGSSENSGTENEWIEQTLQAGTYYARVATQETGDNAYVFRYGVDADATRDGADDLGDITDLSEVQFPTNTLDGVGDAVDYYQFSLTAAKVVGLALRQLDFNADLFLEDDAGTVLGSSENSGTENEWIEQTLLAGTYYARVQAQEAGDNAYVFRYGVGAPDDDEVARLEGRGEQGSEPTSDPTPQEANMHMQEPPSDQHDHSQHDNHNTEEGDTDAPASTSTTATIAVDEYVRGQAPIHFRGSISHSDDVDWIRVMLKADMVFRITVLGRREGSSSSGRTLTRPYLLGLYKGDDDYIDDTDGSLDPQKPHKSYVVYTADANANYYVAVGSRSGETGTYDLRVVWFDDDAHPDNINTKGTIAVGGSLDHKLNFRGDVDWYKTTLTAGTTYQIRMTNKADPNIWPKFYISDSAGEVIARSVYERNSAVSLSYTPAETGTYFIVAYSFLMDIAGNYTLTLSEE